MKNTKAILMNMLMYLTKVPVLTTRTLVFGAVEVIRYTDKRAESAERVGHIRFATAAEADEESIGQFLLKNVEEGSMIWTDEWSGYSKMTAFQTLLGIATCKSPQTLANLSQP